MPEASGISLVEATPADVNLIFSWMLQLRQDEHVAQHAGVNAVTIQEALRNLISSHNLGRVWIIRADETPVGYAALIFYHSLEFAGRCGLLDEFFLQKEYRGKRIGKAAIEWICTIAPKLGVRALFLEVSPGNQAAQRLYRSAGFEARPYNFLVHSTYTMSDMT